VALAAPLGKGSCKGMTPRAGEEQSHEKSGQSALAAARSAKLTGGEVDGCGAALMFADTATGLGRASATILAAPGVC
jgi:hypothetical protein